MGIDGEDALEAGLREAERRSRNNAMPGGGSGGQATMLQRVEMGKAPLATLRAEEAQEVAARALESTPTGRAILRRRLRELRATKRACVAVLRLLQTTPWSLSGSFVNWKGASGGGVLSLSGPNDSLAGDPSGCRLGFSFVKEPGMKKRTGQKQASFKREGTDRDIRKLTKTQLREMLLDYGLDRQDVMKMLRWDLVRAVKAAQAALANQRTMDGKRLAFDDMKFISQASWTQLERQKIKKKQARTIHRAQLKALRDADPVSSGSDTEDSSDSESEAEGSRGLHKGGKGGPGDSKIAKAAAGAGGGNGSDEAAIAADFDVGSGDDDGDDDEDESGSQGGHKTRSVDRGSAASRASGVGGGRQPNGGGGAIGQKPASGSAIGADRISDWEKRAAGTRTQAAADAHDEAQELEEHRIMLRQGQGSSGSKRDGDRTLASSGIGFGGWPLDDTLRVLPAELLEHSNPAFVDVVRF